MQSLLAVWYLSGATHRRRQVRPAVTLHFHIEPQTCPATGGSPAVACRARCSNRPDVRRSYVGGHTRSRGPASQTTSSPGHWQSSSGIQGNVSVPFCRDWARAIPPSYPAEAHHGAGRHPVILPVPKGGSTGEHQARLHIGGVFSPRRGTRPHYVSGPCRWRKALIRAQICSCPAALGWMPSSSKCS
jgi:hypothetical protein